MDTLFTPSHSRQEKMTPLPISFYRNDVLPIAKDLLGRSLYTQIDGKLAGGIIIETEAYTGINDRASHSYNNRRTPRTEVMYNAGGVAYVYLCYGIHHLLNIITGDKEEPQGVLIRAIQPTHGIDAMLARRGKTKIDPTLTSGPGSLTAALGITLKQYGCPLNSSQLWISESKAEPQEILTGPRIGIDYAGPDALLPYRFRILENLSHRKLLFR